MTLLAANTSEFLSTADFLEILRVFGVVVAFFAMFAIIRWLRRW